MHLLEDGSSRILFLVTPTPNLIPVPRVRAGLGLEVIDTSSTILVVHGCWERWGFSTQGSPCVHSPPTMLKGLYDPFPEIIVVRSLSEAFAYLCQLSALVSQVTECIGIHIMCVL